MSSKTLSMVDPDLVALLAQLPNMTPGSDTLTATRDIARTLTNDSSESNHPVDRIELEIPSLFAKHTIRAYLYRPQAPHDRRPGLLHLHGGGFIAGHPFMSDATNREIAHELDCCILSVDYRLAPETPHPGPIEDCYSALDWLFQNAASFGIDPWRLALKGDSAGGGLAASLALLNRDCGTIPLIFQLLIYPMLDDRTGSVQAPCSYAGEFVWTEQSNRFAWASLLGRPPGSYDTPYTASAARAPNLRGLPPAFIAVGQLDLFVEENIEYARQLVRDGVPVELHVYPGAYHGFDQVAGCEISRACTEASRAALRRAFARAVELPSDI